MKTMEHMEDIPSAEEMEVLAKQKSHELFALCDTEEKGFITKRDMQRLQTEIGLDPEQLEAVFDSLDDDKNGYLTLEEFTSGFGKHHELVGYICVIYKYEGSNLILACIYEHPAVWSWRIFFRKVLDIYDEVKKK